MKIDFFWLSMLLVSPSMSFGDLMNCCSAGIITVDAKWPTNESSPGAGDGCYDRSCAVSVTASAAFIPLPSQYMLGGAFQITLKGGSQLVIQR